MIRKPLCALMAILFALFVAFPASAYDGTFTTTKSYEAGYTILNYTYFYTESVSKASSYLWYSATDNNTETYYVDDYGNEYNGKHYTSVFYVNTQITGEQTVYFGNTKTFTSFYSNYASTATSIRLKIRNGSAIGLGYKTKGSFVSVKGDPNIA